MKCPKCGKSIARTVYTRGEWLTPCCDGIKEVSKTDYSSPKSKQRLQWQREKHAKDIMQPWEVKKASKGWQPNKDFIKAYKDDPSKLSMFSEQELKDSGEVTQKQSCLSRTRS